jgi:hypothetical protein
MIDRFKEPYKNCLNGVGGKIEEEEYPIATLFRETLEETGLSLIKDMSRNIELMTIKYPSNVILYVYYSVLKEDFDIIKHKHLCPEGRLELYSPQRLIVNYHNQYLAGEGNIPYFINYALIVENELREKKVSETEMQRHWQDLEILKQQNKIHLPKELK